MVLVILIVSCKIINSSWSKEIKNLLKDFTGSKIFHTSIISLGKGKGHRSQAQHARKLWRDMGRDHKLEYAQRARLRTYNFANLPKSILILKIWFLAWQTGRPAVSHAQLFIFLASSHISESPFIRQEKTCERRTKCETITRKVILSWFQRLNSAKSSQSMGPVYIEHLMLWIIHAMRLSLERCCGTKWLEGR